MVTEDVFITRNVIIDLEAVVVLFSLCNSFIAFNPKGVAALPSPNIFITIFDDIYAIAGSPLGISGNTTLIILDNLLDIITKASANNIIIDSIATINKSEYKVYRMTVIVENKDILEKFMNDLLNLNFVQKVEREVI